MTWTVHHLKGGRALPHRSKAIQRNCHFTTFGKNSFSMRESVHKHTLSSKSVVSLSIHIRKRLISLLFF